MHPLASRAERSRHGTRRVRAEGAAMGVSVTERRNLVGGEWVDAVDGAVMDVLNPATEETIARVPRGSEGDVARAVAAAKRALPEWRETTPGERAELLLRLATALEERAAEFV